jgi:tRNA pseudouridine38-40 synthase
LPKKRTAVLLGFSGTGCKGMQMSVDAPFIQLLKDSWADPTPSSILLPFSQKDPSVKTIEGILFEAFVKAGAISKDNSNDSNKVGLARSARTDAGVQ